MGFRLFPKNLSQWKVVGVAFVTAATFWFFNSLNKDYTTNLNYPVEFSFNKDSLIAVRNLPSNIELDVTGGGWSLLRKTAIFSPQPLTIELFNPVDVSHVSWLEVLPSIREQIADLNVNQVLEDTLSIQIEPILQKWVRPRIDSLGINLEPGHRVISTIRVEEDSILLSGPRSFIDTLGGSFIVGVLEEDIDQNFRGTTTVIPQDLRFVNSTPTEISVGFDVDRFNTLQIEIPVELINFPEDSSLRPEQGTVSLQFVVQQSRQQDYAPSDFIVMTDLSMLRSSDSSVLVMVTGFPDAIEEVKVTPEVLRVIKSE